MENPQSRVEMPTTMTAICVDQALEVIIMVDTTSVLSKSSLGDSYSLTNRDVLLIMPG